MSLVQGLLSSYSMFGPKGVALVAKARLCRQPVEIAVSLRGIKHPVRLRLRTSDVSSFSEVLLNAEYAWNLAVSPRVIVDAGANIGMASVFFANRYPEAKIIAIEPEERNFNIMQKNLAPYPNVSCVRAALWNSDKSLTIEDPGLDKQGFGQYWGFQTVEQGSAASRGQEVDGITVDELMSRFGIEYIDFFKVDIEGAEKEVFANSSMWIDKIGVLAIELHDRIRAGCSRSVYLATKEFEWEFRRGETMFMGKGSFPVSNGVKPPVASAWQASESSKLSSQLPCQIVASH